MRTKPQLDHTTVIVRGDTYQMALANVKKRYGPNAAIVESREARVKSQDSLEEQRIIEVVVALSGEEDKTPAKAKAELKAAMAQQVDRIEKLVTELEQPQQAVPDPDQELLSKYPLTSGLLRAGTTKPAVLHLARLWQATEVDGATAEPRLHLRQQIKTNRGNWLNFGGCHVLLGESGSGKTTLCLGVASQLAAKGQKVLVLMAGARHKGEIKYLQEEARVLGIDAAILKQGQELDRAEQYFNAYDAVLIDTPAIGQSERIDSSLHHALADNTRFHRHLVVPVDADAGADARLWKHARDWNCDWVALTRRDLAARPGRALEVAMASPCSLSLQSTRHNGETTVSIIEAESLISGLLATARPQVVVKPQDFAAKAVEV
jgi:flagellar biosynthesis GTPase FlhF